MAKLLYPERIAFRWTRIYIWYSIPPLPWLQLLQDQALMPERWPKTARDAWAAGMNTRLANYIYMVISLTTAFRRYSRVHFGVTCVGEFSNDIMIVVFF